MVEEEPLPEAGGVVVLPELVLEPEPELVEPLPVLELAGGVVLGAGVVEAGGAAAGAAVWFDGCLAQAVKSTAAASALRATFVFIDSTPGEMRASEERTTFERVIVVPRVLHGSRGHGFYRLIN